MFPAGRQRGRGCWGGWGWLEPAEEQGPVWLPPHPAAGPSPSQRDPQALTQVRTHPRLPHAPPQCGDLCTQQQPPFLLGSAAPRPRRPRTGRSSQHAVSTCWLEPTPELAANQCFMEALQRLCPCVQNEDLRVSSRAQLVGWHSRWHRQLAPPTVPHGAPPWGVTPGRALAQGLGMQDEPQRRVGRPFWASASPRGAKGPSLPRERTCRPRLGLTTADAHPSRAGKTVFFSWLEARTVFWPR